MTKRTLQSAPAKTEPYPTLKFFTERARDSYLVGICGYFFYSRPESEDKDGFFLIHLHPVKTPLRSRT